MLVTLVRLQQLPPLCLVDWELASSLQAKAAVLAAQLPTVLAVQSPTPQLDCFYLVEQVAAAAQQVQAVTSQPLPRRQPY
jgi:hypothetical protein